jgi:glycosyltransferase involved in cell wall biosynthesis
VRILLCHNHYRDAGGESAVFDAELRGLRTHGHEVATLTRDNADLDELGLLRKAAAVPQGFFALDARREVATLVESFRPQLAIVQNTFPLLSPSVYAALHAARVPVIQAVYNYRLICPGAHLYTEGAICERCLGGNFAHAVVHRCYRDSAPLSAWYAAILAAHHRLGTFTRCIDRFMVPDEFLAGKLVQGGLPRSKMRVNPNPFFVAEHDATTRHDGYFLFVGRLVRQKGILTLLDAVAQASADARLIVVGMGELESEVKGRIATPALRDKVQFRGAVWGEQLGKLLAGCSGLVLPSEWYDNLPQIACQALAVGKPIVASRIDGLPEYIRDGDNGFLFAPGDARDLGRALERLQGHDAAAYAELARRCRRYAEAELDYAAHHARLLIIADELRAEGKLRD